MISPLDVAAAEIADLLPEVTQLRGLLQGGPLGGLLALEGQPFALNVGICGAPSIAGLERGFQVLELKIKL